MKVGVVIRVVSKIEVDVVGEVRRADLGVNARAGSCQIAVDIKLVGVV